MAKIKSVWMIFACNFDSDFPNFYPVAAYETRGQAKRTLNKLPKEMRYDLFKIPVNKFFGEVEDGKVNSLLGLLHHEHINSDPIMIDIRELEWLQEDDEGNDEK